MHKFVLAAFVLAVTLPFVSAPVVAQNDRIRHTPTGWSWQYGISSATIDAQLAAGMRPFAFHRVASDSYDTVFVSNTGSQYAVSNSAVLYGLTASGLSSALAIGGWRILDLEAYNSGLGTRFNAIVVPNSGATAATGWAWVHGQTWAQISTWLASNPTLRLIDIDYYDDNGAMRYSAVAIPNSGANAQPQYWYGTNATESDIETLLQANDGRLIDVEVISANTGDFPRYAYIMIPKAGVRSDWFPDISNSGIPAFVAQYGSRIISLERFTNSVGATRYSVVLVDNAEDQTGRIRDYIDGTNGEDGGFSSASNFLGGKMGFMLKEVGGPVLAALLPDEIWEPASTVKLLHAIYAIRQCSLANEDLANMVEYRNLATSDPASTCTSCPFDWICPARFINLEESIRLMLEPSNNNALIALERRFGVNNLNGFADALGFGDVTLFRQDCQCAVTLNTASCTDICAMMELVADGSLFNQFWQDTLYRLMNDLDNQGYALYPVLSSVIDQEAALTNLTPSEVAAFRDQMRFANKGGLYDCGRYFKTEGGWASIPFKYFIANSWETIGQQYTFAIFIHDTVIGSRSDVVYSAKQEIIREQIREALQTWDGACTTPGFFSHPGNSSKPQGQNATFSAIVLGGGDGAAYQWEKEVSPGLWSTLINLAGQVSGATTATLTLIGVDPSDAGRYRVRYSSVCGTVTSQAATLTVTPTICPGNANNDSIVDFNDINAVIANWLGAGPEGDANDDNVVNFDDINTVIANWLNTCP